MRKFPHPWVKSCSSPNRRHLQSHGAHNRHPNIFACSRPRVGGPNPPILPTPARHRRCTITLDQQAGVSLRKAGIGLPSVHCCHRSTKLPRNGSRVGRNASHRARSESAKLTPPNPPRDGARLGARPHGLWNVRSVDCSSGLPSLARTRNAKRTCTISRVRLSGCVSTICGIPLSQNWPSLKPQIRPSWRLQVTCRGRCWSIIRTSEWRPNGLLWTASQHPCPMITPAKERPMLKQLCTKMITKLEGPQNWYELSP